MNVVFNVQSLPCQPLQILEDTVLCKGTEAGGAIAHQDFVENGGVVDFIRIFALPQSFSLVIYGREGTPFQQISRLLFQTGVITLKHSHSCTFCLRGAISHSPEGLVYFLNEE
jgi:hypothetical protein